MTRIDMYLYFDQDNKTAIKVQLSSPENKTSTNNLLNAYF